MELFHTLYIVCLAGMILCLLITIILYFKLNIQSTIGFLTGRSEKREIKAIKEAGVKDRNQHRHMTPEVQRELGIRRSGELKIRQVEGITGITVTRRLEDGSEEVTEVLAPLPLDEEKTTVLYVEKPDFYIEREIMFIHTEEVL